MNRYFKIILSFLFIVLLQSCATTSKKPQSVHGDKPLIDTAKIIVEGREDMDKKVREGPKPYDSEVIIRGEKRRTITTENVKNYVTISDEYTHLKQLVSINFQGLDFNYVMSLMADIGEVNILVGDEVSGTVNAKIDNVGWDIAFQTLLDMKTLVADINVANGIIRVHTPAKLTEQETAKSSRAEVLKKKIALEESVEPILAEIFRLYYISPAQAKTTLEDLFSTQGAEGASTMSNLKITVENTTRSIIVRGHEPDLDVIDAVIREIDVKTKQVLIEAFIVEANSDFERALGVRLGGYYKRSGNVVGGVQAGTSGDAGIAAGTAALAGTTDSITDFTAAGKTSGIGILRKTGSAVLKAEITALELLGMGRTISNPKIFTLDNQTATITQGEEIPYASSSAEGSDTSFKEAALKMTVTPSIIGDGNVLLDIKVNNDTPNRSNPGDPAINKMEISTKLLIADGDIAVIGGIKKNQVTNSKQQTPGIGDVPFVGNLFKGKSKTDNMDELLIFIAPRIL